MKIPGHIISYILQKVPTIGSIVRESTPKDSPDVCLEKPLTVVEFE